MQKDIIKRYVPVHAVGTFICVNCVIESSKNYILDEFPEVVGIETHNKDGDPENLADIAIKCLVLLAKKFPPTVNMFFLDAGYLINSNNDGTLFIGSSFEDMNMEESKPEFITRVKNDIMAFNLMKDKDDDDMDESEKDHYKEMFEMGELFDIYFTFTDKEYEDDIDDMDIGYEDGMSDGIDYNYLLVQIALYKMFKKKKIKDLAFILEEIHNTISGMMDDDIKVWEKNFKKWSINNKKKDSHLEDDIKQIKKENK